jgi:hypothetical protein
VVGGAGTAGAAGEAGKLVVKLSSKIIICIIIIHCTL